MILSRQSSLTFRMAAHHVAVATALLLAAARLAAADTYQLNETIEVSTTGAWDRATIIEVGAPGSDHEGQYKVHFIGYSTSYDRWLQPIYFRKLPAGTPAPAALKAGYQLNDRIEVNTTGAWDKATIIEVGAPGGEHEGEFKVHFDGYGANYDRWLLPVYFRKIAGEPATSAAPRTDPAQPSATPAPPAAAVMDSSTAPRPGKYTIMSYGAVGRPPLFLGHLELLPGGKYRISHTSSGGYYGEGSYSFDAATGAVKWLSGPCKDDGWTGAFTVERSGKTHKIRLRSTTIATNTVE